MNDDAPHKFSDVIGALVASVAHARSVADVEALRIAYRYRENALLKGMPIPRLRFRRVSISLPVILTDLIPGAPAEINLPHVIEAAVGKAFGDGLDKLKATLARAMSLESPSEEEKRRLVRYERLMSFVVEGKFPERFGEEFRRHLGDSLRALVIHQGGTPPADAAIRDAVGDAADSTFTAFFNEATFQYIQRRVQSEGGQFDAERARQDTNEFNKDAFILELKNYVRHAAEDAAIKKATVAPDFTVTVNTDDIKNAGGGPDAVTRLSMVLVEEGLEWLTEVTHDGTESTKLIPE